MGKASYIHGTAASEQQRLAILNEMTNPSFLRFLDLRGNERVLEVGSGLGLLARDVAEAIPGGTVWGLEHSARQLQRAPRQVANLRFVLADAHGLPFPDESFDVVYCRYLLEHVADPVCVLREMHRVLRPGGRALAQENNIFATSFDPACPTFDALWRRFGQLQSQLGGDAEIGKRLFAYFKAAEFSAVQLSVDPEVHWFGSERYAPWLENLIGNIRSGEEELIARRLATQAEIDAAVRGLKELIANPAGSAFFYWNRAMGFKSA